MDDKKFDALTRSLAGGASRRGVLKGLFGGMAGSAAAAAGLRRASAQDEPPVEGAQDGTETVDTAVCPAENTCGGNCCESGQICWRASSASLVTAARMSGAKDAVFARNTSVATLTAVITTTATAAAFVTKASAGVTVQITSAAKMARAAISAP